MNQKKLLAVIVLVLLAGATSATIYFAIKNKLDLGALYTQNSDKKSEQTDTATTGNNAKGSPDPTIPKEKTRLVYQADLSQIKESDKQSAIAGVRDVLERRINSYGISESDVKAQGDRIIVEMAGVKDVSQAVKMIGETPLLEFKEEMTDAEKAQMREQYKDSNIAEQYLSMLYYKTTGLGGRQLSRADIYFDPNTYQPEVQLQFNDEGTKLFKDITSRNIGRKVAVFLDGTPISIPTVETAITDGEAIISGNFTVDEAKTLVQRLNAGALPVPITLLSQQTVNASSE